MSLARKNRGQPLAPGLLHRGEDAQLVVHHDVVPRGITLLGEVEQRYPAWHYVMVDDKLRILAAMKQSWRERLTTVFPRQGHYALDPAILAAFPPADLAIEAIGDLARCDSTIFFGRHHENDPTIA